MVNKPWTMKPESQEAYEIWYKNLKVFTQFSVSWWYHVTIHHVKSLLSRMILASYQVSYKPANSSGVVIPARPSLDIPPPPPHIEIHVALCKSRCPKCLCYLPHNLCSTHTCCQLTQNNLLQRTAIGWYCNRIYCLILSYKNIKVLLHEPVLM